MYERVFENRNTPKEVLAGTKVPHQSPALLNTGTRPMTESNQPKVLTIPRFLAYLDRIPAWQRKLYMLEWQRRYCSACGGTLTDGPRSMCMHCIILGQPKAPQDDR